MIPLVLAAVVPVVAQQSLTLASAQAEARAHAPDVAELTAVVAGAEAVSAQAGRVFRQNPEVSASYANGSLVGRPDESSWSVGARLPVDISGSRKARSASAAADLARTRFDREDGLRALDEQVAIAVADVALEQRLAARGQRMVDLLTVASDAAHRQLDVGQGTELDADSADLDLAAARVTAEQAQGDLMGARARLARLLGRDSAIDLVVDDPPERPMTVTPPDLAALVDRDPRVQAAQAEVTAATFEGQMLARLVTPMPTLGLDVDSARRDIPAGAFTGDPFANSLSALWSDRELVFNMTVPVPVFDRQQEPRARATGRLLTAEARLETVRGTVRSELDSAWATFVAAQRAAQAVATMPALIDRDTDFVEQAVRAGAFDALTRTQALRRLTDTGRTMDTAIHDYRVARAAWIRRSLQ
jgi:cobalt-zinc-cadmium efflux system outer membrane protein